LKKLEWTKSETIRNVRSALQRRDVAGTVDNGNGQERILDRRMRMLQDVYHCHCERQNQMLKRLRDCLTNRVVVAKTAILGGKSKLDRDCQLHAYFIWNNIVAAITNSARRLHANDVWLGAGARSQSNQYPNGSDNATSAPHINYQKIPVARR